MPETKRGRWRLTQQWRMSKSPARPTGIIYGENDNMKAFCSALALAALISAPAMASDAVKQRIEASLRATGQPVRVTAVEPSPVKGLLEVELNGSERMYASEDGQYLLAGELFELETSGPVSVTDRRLEGERRELFSDFDLAQTVTFKAADQKAEVMVFTDPTCGYCRRLHEEMDELNASGITVHYLAYPRAGVDSAPGQLMAQVWCAKDQQKAMTESKITGKISEKTEACDNPVAEQYSLGGRIGVRGTPAVFSMDGRQLGGYLPPAQMSRALGLN